uniref:Uncharacterized protein n=1 Tax=Catagonus wagneri TaxID=51154 RepID=A0A8C3YEF5_9CETA
MKLSMLCTVLAQLNAMKSQSQKTRWKMIVHDLKDTTGPTSLLGLTWGFAVFCFGTYKLTFFSWLRLPHFSVSLREKGHGREQWQLRFCCRWFRVCDLHHSSRQRRVLNPLSEARDRTRNLMVPSHIRFHCATMGTPNFIFFNTGDFDEDPNCFPSLSCAVVPNCVRRRMLPAEIKMNSIHKDFSSKSQQRSLPPPPPDGGRR